MPLLVAAGHRTRGAHMPGCGHLAAATVASLYPLRDEDRWWMRRARGRLVPRTFSESCYLFPCGGEMGIARYSVCYIFFFFSFALGDGASFTMECRMWERRGMDPQLRVPDADQRNAARCTMSLPLSGALAFCFRFLFLFSSCMYRVTAAPLLPPRSLASTTASRSVSCRG
ncbi:hypothetical protein B0H14DRAFT_445491, partial [Mycena olivaceomarginata]